MIVENVSADHYSQVVKAPYFIFGTAAFGRLNEHKVSRVAYLLFKNNKYRLGVIGGISDGVFSSPFSAPFGGFTPLSDDLRLPHIEEAVDSLERWCRENRVTRVRVTFPPALYNSYFIDRSVNVLFRKGFEITAVEINHYFDTQRFDNDAYPGSMWHNARKNLRIAMDNRLIFEKCHSEDQRRAAYDVIKLNREKRGFPLRMSWLDVEKTTALIKADSFLATTADNVYVGAAIIFHVSSNAVQVVYWGDDPAHSALKTMNFLSFNVFKYYRDSGVRFIDIGQSTDNSVPNYGLCEFKESIGCDVATKFSFAKDLL